MSAGRRVRPDDHPVPTEPSAPEISACRSSPGTTVFIEAGNTDGWIASDRTVDLRE